MADGFHDGEVDAVLDTVSDAVTVTDKVAVGVAVSVALPAVPTRRRQPDWERQLSSRTAPTNGQQTRSSATHGASARTNPRMSTAYRVSWSGGGAGKQRGAGVSTRAKA